MRTVNYKKTLERTECPPPLEFNCSGMNWHRLRAGLDHGFMERINSSA